MENLGKECILHVLNMRYTDTSCGGWTLATLLAAQSPALVLAGWPLCALLPNREGAGLCYHLYFHT